MFKNLLDAGKQLANKIKRDRIQPTKIIGLSENGKKIANYLKKLLPLSTNHEHLATILITDDGNLNLNKLTHAVNIYRQKKVKKIIVGIPVYKHEDVLELEKHADAVYTIHEPETFISAEEFYQDL
jgi:predicted phosphoribosyltransferase